MLPVTPVSTRHDRLKPASLLEFSRRGVKINSYNLQLHFSEGSKLTRFWSISKRCMTPLNEVRLA